MQLWQYCVYNKNYRYAVHVSDALCVHHQEHYKL